MPVPAVLQNKRFYAGLALGLLLGVLAVAGWLLADELRTSRRQAHWLSHLAQRQRFELAPGPTQAVRYPAAGPYDKRLGYAQLPAFLQRLGGQGYEVAEQARMSPDLLEWMDRGLYPVYAEKTRAGLTLRDCRADDLFTQRIPERAFDRFEAVSPLLVNALLFIENRELLQPQVPTQNPAIEWDRFARAAFDQLMRRIDDDHAAAGGSTLATQIEKYRHSPDGRTDSAIEKLHQMASASLRAYSLGPDTHARRRQIVLDYLNSVPLAAQNGFGEVNGLADGLWAWYGRDRDEIDRLLPAQGPVQGPAQSGAVDAASALLFKQALSLMIAQRRPAYYLVDGAADLARLTDAHLRVLAATGGISTALRDAALPQPIRPLTSAPPRKPVSFADRKAVTALRTRLSALLGVPRAYDVDRLDLLAQSSIDARLQRAASQALADLRTPEGAHAAGLYGENLLKEGDDPSRLTVSFTLFERGPQHHLLRAQTDNLDQPFDLNDGARLDLGSTAKLRTLVTYLELVAELHARYSALSNDELRALDVSPRDRLGTWAREHLLQDGDHTLAGMLAAAMQRTYSASPAETFYTGGGQHTFENFDAADNGRVMTLHEALQRSVNLVFIRLMRDVVRHLMLTAPGHPLEMLDNAADPRRRAMLERFADVEGRQFLARFHARYKGKSADEATALLLDDVRPTPARLAAVYFGLHPQGDAVSLAGWLDGRLPEGARSVSPQVLFERYGPGRLNLEDRAYVARVHPLELWLAAHLQQQPGAGWADIVKASAGARQEAYGWLFKTRAKRGQDIRIQNLLEQDAFAEIARRWKRLGYPFDDLTPSYATSLGASGDRPAALAELMGILVNDGVRRPVVRLPSLRFAAGTPYEVLLRPREAEGERLLPAEVTQAARRALLDVVANGTARRLKDVLTLADGTVVPIGGKTGTGDHRFDTYGAGGRLVSSRVVNRTATLVFLIGDRYWGTVMAYVHEPYAANYKFTSALPSQLLKSLVPALLPLLREPACAVGSGAAP